MSSGPPRCARRSVRFCASSQHRHSLARHSPRKFAAAWHPTGRARRRRTRESHQTPIGRADRRQTRDPHRTPIGDANRQQPEPFGEGRWVPLAQNSDTEDEVRVGSASPVFQVSRFGAPKERRLRSKTHRSPRRFTRREACQSEQRRALEAKLQQPASCEHSSHLAQATSLKHVSRDFPSQVLLRAVPHAWSGARARSR